MVWSESYLLRIFDCTYIVMGSRIWGRDATWKIRSLHFSDVENLSEKTFYISIIFFSHFQWDIQLYIFFSVFTILILFYFNFITVRVIEKKKRKKETMIFLWVPPLLSRFHYFHTFIFKRKNTTNIVDTFYHGSLSHLFLEERVDIRCVDEEICAVTFFTPFFLCCCTRPPPMQYLFTKKTTNSTK